MQLYGGSLFKTLQDKADNTFCTLPAPKASIEKTVIKPGAPVYSPPVNMHDYMDYGAGCFDGEGIVKLSNGCTKQIKDLKKGDEIVCENGQGAKVVALVITTTQRDVELVEINGVKLTPWHPVKVGGAWKFPCEIKKPVAEYCDCVYNLVLNTNHIACINGLSVVTLGHGFHDSSVVEHAYFGSAKVLEDLMRFDGWTDGNVVIKQWNPTRDPTTGLIQGLIN